MIYDYITACASRLDPQRLFRSRAEAEAHDKAIIAAEMSRLNCEGFRRILRDGAGNDHERLLVEMLAEFEREARYAAQDVAEEDRALAQAAE